jgi:hydrogenase expression/formation protein HypC
MCLAIPARVLAITDTTATVDLAGNQTTAELSLLESVHVGDYILVHAGMAIQKFDEAEALKTLELFKELAAAMGG